MSEDRKGRRNVRLTGVIFILIGILIGVVGSVLPHYPAVVTNVSEAHSTHSKKSGRKYKVFVDATYVDENGNGKEITGLRVVRKNKAKLPQVGDTIQVTGKLFRLEYRFGTIIGTSIFFVLLGVLSIFRSFKAAKKKMPKPGGEEEGP